MNSTEITEQYFSRFAKVYGIGAEGLELLRNAKVAVVGCGGVGSCAADYLARSGIGHLRLIDQDIVGASNLHRIHLVKPVDLYRPKVEAIAESLGERQPWLNVETFLDTVREDNVEDAVDKPDLIIDGLDNFRSRYIVNDYSVRIGIPYLFASAVGNQAHSSLFTRKDESACLACAFPAIMTARQEDSCESLGVSANIVGLLGAIIADETVKHLLGHESRLAGRLLTIDLAGPEFLYSTISRTPNCPTCGLERRDTSSKPSKTGITMLCGEHTASIIPPEHMNLDLLRVAQFVNDDLILARTNQALVYREGRVIVSVFKTGRLIIDGVESEADATAQAAKIWKKMGIIPLTL